MILDSPVGDENVQKKKKGSTDCFNFYYASLNHIKMNE